MKDKQGNIIIIGSTVTFTEEVKPRTLIGRVGTVEGYGSSNIKVIVPWLDGTRMVRVSPSHVLVGKHYIEDPILKRALQDNQVKKKVYTFYARILDSAVSHDIISPEQKKRILELTEVELDA